MAPSHADSASSDEEEAPESFSLAQSKQHVQKQDNVLKQIQAAEKEKKRIKNKERDRRLKEQAENSKRKRKGDGGDADLEARMKRAMQEADAEMGEASSSDEEEEFMGIEGDSSEEEDEDSSEKDDNDDDDMESQDKEYPSVSKMNPNHLPDHLFSSAFASNASKSMSKRKANEDRSLTRPARKRGRAQASPKDTLIGSRAIRTLAQSGPLSGASTLPSAKVRKFLDRNLALKGGKSRTRGWERKPANIGVMRRDGPAASFVRKR